MAQRLLTRPDMNPRSVLVAYITRDGYSHMVADAIAQRLRDHGLEIDVANLELCIRYPERYDGVALACAARFGHFADAMASFIAEHLPALASRPTAFLAIDSSRNAAGHVDRFLRDVRWDPSLRLMLPGLKGARVRRVKAWLEDKLEAQTMTHVRGPTDWVRVRALADELASRVTMVPLAARESFASSGRS